MSIILIASLFWYFHLLAVINFHSGLVERFFSTFHAFMQYKFKEKQISKLTLIFHEKKDRIKGYYIDPFAMIISMLYKPFQTLLLPLFYIIYKILIPGLYDLIISFWDFFGPVIRFLIIIRHGRNFLPYFIKWHWGFIFFLKLIEKSYLGLCQRSTFYSEVLELMVEDFEDEEEYNIRHLLYLFQYYCSELWLLFLFLFHIGLMYYGLVHAIFGQYFYFPYITFNLSEHIGRRVGRDLLDDLTYSPYYTYHIKSE